MPSNEANFMDRRCDKCLAEASYMARDENPKARDGIVYFDCGSSYDFLEVGGLARTIECQKRERQTFDALGWALKELMDHWECGTHPGRERWSHMMDLAGAFQTSKKLVSHA